MLFPALWFRLSERLKFDLPLNKNFQNEVWKLILKRSCYEFFEIGADRQTPKRLDRQDFYFNNEISEEAMSGYMRENYFIYDYSPVDDPVISGSCSEFRTRRKLDDGAVKGMSVEEVEET